jgi:hypothetical protein
VRCCLKSIFEPYEEGIQLSENAPPEAIEAKKKFMELFENEYKRNKRIDLL